MLNYKLRIFQVGDPSYEKKTAEIQVTGVTRAPGCGEEVPDLDSRLLCMLDTPHTWRPQLVKSKARRENCLQIKNKTS